MTSTQYSNLKNSFEKLTGKKAEDNLSAFFNYVNVINLIDVRDRMEDLRKTIEKIEKKA